MQLSGDIVGDKCDPLPSSLRPGCDRSEGTNPSVSEIVRGINLSPVRWHRYPCGHAGTISSVLTAELARSAFGVRRWNLDHTTGPVPCFHSVSPRWIALYPESVRSRHQSCHTEDGGCYAPPRGRFGRLPFASLHKLQGLTRSSAIAWLLFSGRTRRTRVEGTSKARSYVSGDSLAANFERRPSRPSCSATKRRNRRGNRSLDMKHVSAACSRNRRSDHPPGVGRALPRSANM